MRPVIHAAALAAALIAPAAAAAQVRPAPTSPDWSWQPTPPPPPTATLADPRPPGGPIADPWAPNAYGAHGGAAARPDTFSGNELVAAGHAFFGETSSGLAQAIEGLLARFGAPNGYVLGEEGSGAVIGGLRYGEGTLTTPMQSERPIYWQGPSIGWDFGGSGSRVMMLVYELDDPAQMLQRFTGVDGSAYMVGGASVTVMAAGSTYLIPVRTGVGARLGVSLGYLKFTAEPTWNPF
jgi:hypothetical protein